MRIASLDLGSNSFLLLIVDIENGQVINVLHDEQQVTRLGQEVHENRVFHVEALKRAEICFLNYKKIIDKFNVDKVIAVSTSAARDVKNKSALISLGKKYSIPIEIITGPKEAELTYLGSVDAEKSKDISVIDVGGGSTEIIGYEGKNVKGWSLDIGSVRLAEIFEAFDVVSIEKLKSIDEYILNQIRIHNSQLPIIKKAVAVAGTPTTLSAVIKKIDFDPDVIEGSFITREQLIELQENMAILSVEKRKLITGVHPDRADVLVCGISILKNICLYFDLLGFEVSCKGVRFGLAKAFSETSTDPSQRW